MSFSSFSQDTIKTIKVKVSTLKEIKKEMDKCDSLRVAYNKQVLNINNLIETNLSYFRTLQQKQARQIELQNQLYESVKALRKKKKGNWIVPTLIGLAGGLTGGVLLIK